MVFTCTEESPILGLMVRSVLAVLLLGMLPLPPVALQDAPTALDQLAIAPLAMPLAVEEHLSASGVLILDMRSGQMLYNKQSELRRPMASLTKLMTALIIVEHHALNEWMVIPRGVGEIEGNKAYLPVGEQFTVGDLLSALLIGSANDAGYALALFHSGSIGEFVGEMNARAQTLGLKNTHYANPIGLDSSQQWSTPQDTAWLAAFVLRTPAIRERLSRRGQRIWSRAGYEVSLAHTHALMHADTAVRAGKTGTTTSAKQCLLSLVEQGEQEILVVLMHSSRRYADMQIILDAIGQNVPLL